MVITRVPYNGGTDLWRRKIDQIDPKFVPNFTEFLLVTSRLVLCLVYQRFIAVLLLSGGSLAINQLVYLIQLSLVGIKVFSVLVGNKVWSVDVECDCLTWPRIVPIYKYICTFSTLS